MRCWFLCVSCSGFCCSGLFCKIVRWLSLRNCQCHLCFVIAFCLLFLWCFLFVLLCRSVLVNYIICGVATASDNQALRRSSARSRWMDGRLGQNETRYNLIVFRKWWGQYRSVARLGDHGCRAALSLLNLPSLVHFQFFLYDFNGRWSGSELSLLLLAEARHRVWKLYPCVFGANSIVWLSWWRHSRICSSRLATTIIPLVLDASRWWCIVDSPLRGSIRHKKVLIFIFGWLYTEAEARSRTFLCLSHLDLYSTF